MVEAFDISEHRLSLNLAGYIVHDPHGQLLPFSIYEAIAETRDNDKPSIDLSSIPESLRGLKWERYEHGMVFENGNQLLLAVPVITKWKHETTEIHGVTVDCDEDRFRLECTASGETYDFDLTDCNLFVRI